MRWVELHLDGFGRLVDRTLRFAPGLNLIWGPNEAGKSTLQQAILALLYGFLLDGRVTAEQRARTQSFQPWDKTAPFSGALTYTLDDGQTFRVTRTFGPRPATALESLPGGQSVAPQFKSASEGRLFFADAQLGMDRQVFENTCTVRQAELVALDSSANAITETLMRLSASGSSEASVADALALLENALKEQVGTARARTKPLAQAQERLSKLEREREQASQARRQWFSQIVELNQAADRLQQLDLERHKLRYLQACAERDVLRQKQCALDEIEAEIECCAGQVEQWTEWAAFPVELRDDVIRLADQRQRLQKECAHLQPQAEQAQTQLGGVQAQFEQVAAQIGALPDEPSVPVEELPALQAQLQQIELAHAAHLAVQERWQKSRSALAQAEQGLAQERAAVGSLIELGYAGLARLEQQLAHSRQQEQAAAQALQSAQKEWARVGMSEEELARLRQTVQGIQDGKLLPPPRKGCGAIFGGRAKKSQPPPELAIYAQVNPIYERLMQARAALQAAQVTRKNVEHEIGDQLGTQAQGAINAQMFRQAEKRLEAYQHLVADAEQQKRAVSETQAEAATAQQQVQTLANSLRAKLKTLNLNADDPRQALAELSSRRDQQAARERAQAEQAHLRLQIETYQRDVQTWQERQAALKEAQDTLCALLAQAQIDCASEGIPQALDRFHEGAAHHARWREAQTAYQTATASRETLLSNQSGQDMAAVKAALDEQIAAALADHPDWQALQADRSRHEYESLVRQADENWLAERERHSRLSDQIQSAGDGRHPAEIEEEIAETRAAIHRLERFRDALELACSELEAANTEFQKQFAPRVEQLMSEGLSRATQGRYVQAQVDPASLAVSLIAPEIQRPVSAGQLSTGTRDLVYLMLRVAIARLMSRSGEKLPLLLDDPLVQCDQSRQEQTMGYLAQLAGETQIVLFSKDEWTREWVEKRETDAAHGLHILAQ